MEEQVPYKTLKYERSNRFPSFILNKIPNLLAVQWSKHAQERLVERGGQYIEQIPVINMTDWELKKVTAIQEFPDSPIHIQEFEISRIAYIAEDNSDIIIVSLIIGWDSHKVVSVIIDSVRDCYRYSYDDIAAMLERQ